MSATTTAPGESGLIGLTPEVLTTSGLLTMPALWTTVVRHELPFMVLVERYLVVLLTCALLAELLRRLGEGGALTGPAVAPGRAAAIAPSRVDTRPFEAGLFDDGPETGYAPFDDLADASESPLALTPAPDSALDSALGDLPPLDDGLADLDLDADPFASPLNRQASTAD